MQVSQKIPNLLGGVSQQDERIRRENQGTEQINGLSDPAHGLRKRPPSEYVALLEATVSNYEDADGNASAFVHTIDRDLDDKYRVIIRNGDLKVFHATTGAEVTVYFPDGKAYLSSVDFRAVTVEDVTYLMNREEVVEYLSTAATARTPAALIYVRQGNEDTTYKASVGAYNTTYTTPKQTTAGDAPIDTIDIATALLANLTVQTGFTTDYTSALSGSSIYVYRTDGADFTLTTEDGLSDRGLLPIKDSVQSFSDLPPLAPDGFRVEVTGEPGLDEDNYWLEYQAADATEGEEGVWKECVAPGALLGFDNATMPWQLVLRGSLTNKLVNEGSPPLPEIKAGPGTTVHDNWDEKNDVAVTGQVYMDSHNDDVDWQFPAASLGQLCDIDITFNTYAPGDIVQNITLTLERYNDLDVLQETVFSQSYDAQDDWVGYITISAQTTPDVANWNYLKLTMTYQSGSTPTNEGDRCFAKMGSNPITLGYSATKTIDFGDTTQLYPYDYWIKLALGATPDYFTYTPATADEDGPTVAAALQALIDADASYTATVSGGVITVTTDGASAPAVVPTYQFSNSTDVWFPGEALLSGAVNLDGTTLYNLSDGSSATISSYTNTTIKTGGLSGGAENVYKKNDLIQVEATGTTFTFKKVDWLLRDVGNDTTNPFPDFVERTLSDITFFQGRLGFIYADRVFFSAAGKLTKLFRHSARILRDDDPIGAESALPMVASFDAAITWNKNLYLRAENAIVLVSGAPVLTPKTIRLDLAAEVNSSSDCYPVVVGQNLFLARGKTYGTQVMELRQMEVDVLRHTDITQHIPTYIAGRPKTIVGSGSLGIAVLLPQDCSTNYLYVYSFVDQDRQRVMDSWSRWEMPVDGEILQIDMIDGTLGMVVKYTDGVFLETIDLDEEIQT